MFIPKIDPWLEVWTLIAAGKHCSSEIYWLRWFIGAEIILQVRDELGGDIDSLILGSSDNIKLAPNIRPPNRTISLEFKNLKIMPIDMVFKFCT